MLRHLSLKKKLVGGFVLTSLITVVVVGTGLYGLTQIRNNFKTVIESAPLIDAAMEMKISVARDMQMIMELLAAGSPQDLAAVWSEHEKFVEDFDTFAAAILKGGETPEGIIYPARDEGLRHVVREADRFHNDEFQPRIKKIRDLMSLKLQGQDFSREDLGRYDKEADAVGEKMLDTLGRIEDISKTTIKAAQEQTRATTDIEFKLLIIIGIAGVVISFVLGFVITRMITGPIYAAKNLAEHIARGDLTRQVAIDQQDEIGMLAASLNTMSLRLKEVFTDIASGTRTLDNSSTELSAVSEQMADNADQTAGSCTNVATAAEEMGTNMNSVAAATEQAAGNIQMIAAATEEMTATINEIAANTAKSSETTAQAVDLAQTVSNKVDELGAASGQISKVTETIADISEQTNLLALNATIEAARAGEAGKGFAVVAGEIKALAQQTALATSEINDKISGIQSTTDDSVTAIQSIVSVIGKINGLVTTVATAVEEQSATTREISTNINQAAEGIQEVNQSISQTSAVAGEVSRDISGVNHAAGEISTGSSQVNDKARQLAGLAGELKQMIDAFKV